MLSQQGIEKQIQKKATCLCQLGSNKGEKSPRERFLLGGRTITSGVNKELRISVDCPVKSRARKSLRRQLMNKENRLASESSNIFKLVDTCDSPNLLLNSKRNQFHSSFRETMFSQADSYSVLPYSSNRSLLLSNEVSDQLLKAVKQVEEKQIRQQRIFRKKPIQVRFSTDYFQNKTPPPCPTNIKIKNRSYERAQSQQNLIANKQVQVGQLSKRRQEWRSQCVNLEYQKSASKLTHHLTELNFKCTQSINDSQSLRISEVVSESDGSASDSNRSETFSKKIKNIMHMKYSKLEGKRSGMR